MKLKREVLLDDGWYRVERLHQEIFRVIEGGMTAFYLLQGSQRSAIIDTGFGAGNLKNLADSFLAGEKLVINTHVHPDHSNGNGYFGETSMGRIEWEEKGLLWNAYLNNRKEGDPLPSSHLSLTGFSKKLPPSFDEDRYNRFILKGLPTPRYFWEDGDLIDLGGLKLEVIHTPAHTKGGICLLERERGLLFGGDTVIRGNPIWLHLKCSLPPEICFQSYKRLAKLTPWVKHIFSPHPAFTISGKFLRELNEGMEKISRGEIKPRSVKNFGGPGYYYPLKGFGPIFSKPL